ncbi:MAG: sigma-54 dependent transcriptional regulator [Desulfobacterales bacterium]|nr:sigma-54 dependent transcriptional regulator [Desulfobacterales bacterium]
MDTILVVDDERGVRESFNIVLKDHYQVLMAQTGKEAIDIFSKNYVDLVLLDIRLPDVGGVDLLRKLKEMDPGVEIIMVTAVKSIQTAVQAIKSGAYEYVIKPFDVEEVLTVINRALEKRRLVKEVTYLRDELKRVQPFEKMVGNDKKMSAVFELITTISRGDGTVLIQGESGTGKELVARAIHNRGPRKNQPFVVINCAAIPVSLMERELFGHIRGAFTGAVDSRLGKLEIANNGTVFLDDIDSLDIGMQANLLRVIQEKEFERLGSTKVIKVDIRFVAASNRDIHKLIEKGEFREDLFYRLNVFPIELPPLRERRSDIPLLLDHFLKLQSQHTGRPEKKFSEEALQSLVKYDWPGNVRELQNLVERLATITPEPVIRLRDISVINISKRGVGNMNLKDAVTAFEKQYITEFIDFYEGNRKVVADKLGVHRNTLLTKLKEFEIK